MFSIVIATCDRVDALRDLVTSIIDALVNVDCVVEIIVVNDGKDKIPDDVVKIPFFLNNKVTGIRITSTIGYKGAAFARNLGATYATHHYLIFVDDDVRVSPLWLSAYVNALNDAAKQGPWAVVAGGPAYAPLHANKWLQCHQRINLELNKRNQPDKLVFASTINMCIQREAFRVLNGFDESFKRAGAEDKEFNFRWLYWINKCPTRYVSSASVDHYKELNWRSFARTHFTYGETNAHLARTKGYNVFEDKAFNKAILVKAIAAGQGWIHLFGTACEAAGAISYYLRKGQRA